MKALTPPERAILLRVLADTDAIWLPFRFVGKSDAQKAAAIAERRVAFRKIGVPLIVGGGDAERQAGNRDLQALVSRGLVRIHGRGRSHGVALTAAGDNYVRTLTNSRRIDEAWPQLEVVAAVGDSFAGRSNAGMILEIDILLPDHDPKQPLNGDSSVLADFTIDVLPLLVSGYLESASDTQGRLGYCTTQAGRAALDRGNPGVPKSLPKMSRAAEGEFVDLWKIALDQRESWRPSTPNQVWIPLSAGRWPRKPVCLPVGAVVGE